MPAPPLTTRAPVVVFVLDVVALATILPPNMPVNVVLRLVNAPVLGVALPTGVLLILLNDAVPAERLYIDVILPAIILA
jgi:hypothetical protein